MPRKLRSFRADGIVLKHNDYGEADRMLTVYTRQKGKVRALARGVRKVHSRMGGHLEPFTRVSLLLATGRHWYVVSQAEAKDSYASLSEDLEIVGYASYVVEILDRFTYEEEENSALFRLLSSTLDRLNKGDDPLLVVRYYEIRLLDLLGFRPELNHCIVSKEEIKPQDQYFSAALGGVVSLKYGRDRSGLVPISMRALKYLRHFQRSSYKKATRAKINAEIHQELEVLMQYYLTYLLERGLNTPAFLRRVRGEKQKDTKTEDMKE
jgi:DNA repair protein RecO (recombination protein O)